MAGPSLVPCPAGQYRFLPGIEPFSSGVVAVPGHEITHVTLQAPIPYREGFALIDRHLRALGEGLEYEMDMRGVRREVRRGR